MNNFLYNVIKRVKYVTPAISRRGHGLLSRLQAGEQRQKRFTGMHQSSIDNFARIHQSLRVTPAMKAGIADHVWSLEEIAN